MERGPQVIYVVCARHKDGTWGPVGGLKYDMTDLKDVSRAAKESEQVLGVKHRIETYELMGQQELQDWMDTD